MKRALLALPMLAMSTEAHAQAYQCRLPQRAPPLPAIVQEGPTRRMAVTGYTLALSWSPEFCRLQKGDPLHRRQCSGREGRFGFILHGLWPEGPGGRWPQWCPTAKRPSPATVRANLCMMPSTRLIAHEWAKHGSCMVRKPETYFKISRILWYSLRLPDFDLLSRRDGLNAGRLREAFVGANSGWRADQIGLKVNSRGWLEELRLCYGRNFMPIRCDRRRHGPDDDVKVKIWRGL